MSSLNDNGFEQREFHPMDRRTLLCMPLEVAAARSDTAAFRRTREIGALQQRFLTALNARAFPAFRAKRPADPRFQHVRVKPFRRPDSLLKRSSALQAAGLIEPPHSSGAANRPRSTVLLVNVLCTETHAARRIAALFTKEEKPQ